MSCGPVLLGGTGDYATRLVRMKVEGEEAVSDTSDNVIDGGVLSVRLLTYYICKLDSRFIIKQREDSMTTLVKV